LELTCIGSQFQRHFISQLNYYCFYGNENLQDNELAGFAAIMLAYYHCISIDISKIFSTPPWLRLDCELPIMPHGLSYEQAMSALQHAEHSISCLSLEAIFFCPILYVLGMEMASKSDPRRMVDFIGVLRSRRFSVIDRFLAVLRQGWNGIPLS
jgi:hypothetical protein